MQRVGGGFYAFADDAKYIGAVGEVVEVLEKDYTPEGDLPGYQSVSDSYHGVKIRIWADLGGEIKYLNAHGKWVADPAAAQLFKTNKEASNFAADNGEEGPAQYEEAE